MPDDPGAAAPAEPTPDTGDVIVTTDDLGPNGQKAIAEERKARKAAEAAAKKLAAELAKVQEANQSEAEKALAQARAEGHAEAIKTASERLVKAEVKAAAAGKLQDPEDAYGFLDLTSFVDDTGDVDSNAISSAIDELVKTKPYLSAGATPAGAGTGGGGARLQPTPLNSDSLTEAVKAKLGVS
jgi:hypothetical protein